MMNSYSIIRQLTYDIELNTSTVDTSNVEMINHYFKATFSKYLDEALLPYAEDRIVLLDYLELDLGECNLTNFEKHLEITLNPILEKAMNEFLKQAELDKKSNIDLRVNNLPPSFGFEKLKLTNNKDIVLESISFFLITGRLPWWYPIEQLGGIEQSFDKYLDTSKAKELFIWLKKNHFFIKRLVLNFSDELLKKWSKLNGTPSFLLKLQALLFQIFIEKSISSINKFDFRLLFWKTLLIQSDKSKFQNRNQNEAVWNFLYQFIKELKIEDSSLDIGTEGFQLLGNYYVNDIPFSVELLEKLLNPKLNVILPEKKGTNLKPTPKINPDDKGIEWDNNNWLYPSNIENNSMELDSINWIRQEQLLKSKANNNNIKSAKIPFDSMLLKESIKKELKEGVFVQYAGIVLFHPFLPKFFEKVGLWKANQWTYAEANLKAVHFLVFLATGNCSCPEYNLVLFKHLCGVPWNHLINPNFDLSTIEREQANQLLEAVIKHWSVLKNTSIAELQTGFIHREGKLNPMEQDWNLRIAQKPQDILLKQLPWGLSCVRLPWNKEITWVSWT